MAILWIVVGAALVVAISVFHSLNPQVTDLSLFGYQVYGVPMWLLVTVPAAAGLLIGILMNVPARLSAAFRERRFANRLREQDKTVADLQGRVVQLERDLAVASKPEAPVVVEHVKEVPIPVPAKRTGEIDPVTDLPRAA
jgi:uncharacterized integral membrane protein